MCSKVFQAVSMVPNVSIRAPNCNLWYVSKIWECWCGIVRKSSDILIRQKLVSHHQNINRTMWTEYTCNHIQNEHTDTLCYVHLGINNMSPDLSHNRTIEANWNRSNNFSCPCYIMNVTGQYDQMMANVMWWYWHVIKGQYRSAQVNITKWWHMPCVSLKA
jgi:hypothetical protein